MMFSRYARVIAQSFLALGLSYSHAAAQTSATSAESERAPVEDRLSFGFRVGTPITSLISGVSSVESTASTDPPTTTSTEVSGKGLRLVVGPTFEYAVSNDFTVGADFLYRRAGYDSAVTLATQVTDDTDGNIIFQEFQETRLNYFDLPLIVRYFPGKLDPNGARPYVLGGAALRFASGISTTTEFVDEEGVVDTDKTAIDLAQSTAFGGMIGAGIRLVDDVGLRVDLEARFTRWGQNTIQSGPANSNTNQLEFVFGMTF